MDSSDLTMQRKEPETEISIYELCKSILKKIWILLLVAAFAAGITYFAGSSGDEEVFYVSSYKSYLYAEKAPFESADARSIIRIYDYIATNENILDRVIEDSKLDLDGSEIKNMVSFEVDNSSTIITVKVKGEDPSVVYSLTESLNKVVSDELKDQIKNLRVETLVPPSQPALHSNSSSSLKISVMIGILFFILTAIVIIIAEIILDKVKSCSQLEDRTGIVVLGKVPDCRKISGRRV